MKKSIATVLVAFGLFLSVFLTSSAMAGGFGVGIIGAGANFATTGSETEGGGNEEKTIAPDQSASVLYGSIFAEYTFGEMYGMTLGVSYTPMNSVLGSGERTDTNVATKPDSLDDDGTYTAKADISNHATIYIEPTFMTTENLGFYLKGGVAGAMVESLEKIAVGPNSSVYGDERVRGIMYGLGVKGVYDNGYFFKLEAIGIDYQQVKMTSATGNKNTIEANPEQAAVRLAIGYKF